MIILLSVTVDLTHLFPIQYSYQGRFFCHSFLHQGQSTTLPIPRRPQEPKSPNITEFFPPRAPHQNPLPTGLSSCHSLSPMPNLATPRPLFSYGAPPKNNPSRTLPHQDRLSQRPPPTRVRAGAGPTGGWGAVGPPVGWVSSQHGGSGGSEETAACPDPASPASAAGRASGTGGPVGDNTSSRRRGRGKETRVSPGHAGEGESRWTGEGRVNPRPACPAPRSHPRRGTPASRPLPRGPPRPAASA